ncbi:MAG: HAD family hydrolase [Anaerolineales bacterium]|nr:HAD family hydrolase [Anaerolineales bacterium]
MARLKAVLFDLDDTLYPERAFVRSGFKAAAAFAEQELGIGRSTGFEELWAYFESGVRGSTYNLWLEAHGADTERWVPQLVEVYRSHKPEIELYPGVRQLLKTLCARTPLGLITEGNTTTQRNKLAALDLEAMFGVVVITDMKERSFWKPHMRPYINALDKLGVEAARSVYIGDNPRKDFFGARQLGMHTVRVKWPEGLNTLLQADSPAYEADISLPNFDNLLEVLASFEEES